MHRLLKHPTTAVNRATFLTIHELVWSKAVWYKQDGQGKYIVGITNRKGAMAKIKKWLKTGTLNYQ